MPKKEVQQKKPQNFFFLPRSSCMDWSRFPLEVTSLGVFKMQQMQNLHGIKKFYL